MANGNDYYQYHIRVTIVAGESQRFRVLARDSLEASQQALITLKKAEIVYFEKIAIRRGNYANKKKKKYLQNLSSYK